MKLIAFSLSMLCMTYSLHAAEPYEIEPLPHHEQAPYYNSYNSELSDEDACCLGTVIGTALCFTGGAVTGALWHMSSQNLWVLNAPAQNLAALCGMLSAAIGAPLIIRYINKKNMSHYQEHIKKD